MNQAANGAARQGSAGLARHGPEGARRRLRPDGLCAEPRSGAQAQHVQQRPRARAARRAEAAAPTGRSRSSSSTCSRHGKPNAPINVFIHGGAWRQRSVKDYAFLAEMFVRAGAHWIGLDFDGVEGTKGDLLPMADQVRRGVAWVYKNAKSFGGDPNRLYVSGQSSGAHLAGSVVTTDWKDYGVPNDIVKGALLVLGHVRPQAGAAVEALRIRRLHRRDRGEAVLAAPSRPAQLPGDRRPTAPTRRRSSSARTAISPPP